MNYVGSNSLSLRYQKITSGCKDIGIRKFENVTKTQFFWHGELSKNTETFIAWFDLILS